MNPNVPYGLWVIVMSPCRLIHCNKCSIWRKMLIMGESMYVWRPGVHGKSVYLWGSIAANPKMLLKIKSVKKHTHTHLNTLKHI